MGSTPGEAEAGDVDPEAAPGVPGGVPGAVDADPGAPGGPEAVPGGVTPPGKGDPAGPGDPEAGVGDAMAEAPGTAPEKGNGDVEEALRGGMGAPGAGFWGIKPGEGVEEGDTGGREGEEDAAGLTDATLALEVEGLLEVA
ncbi:hypothetical protein ABBQ38_003677 [Trebouxia sp. C0009 RCD-2024]